MQSPTYNLAYAQSIPSLSTPLSTVSSDPAGVLNLLLTPSLEWATAAWFLTSQCSPAVRSQLQDGGSSGWEAYLTQCVGTTVTDDRRAYWTRANQAFGVISQ
jgi:hypothetical protein